MVEEPAQEVSPQCAVPDVSEHGEDHADAAIHWPEQGELHSTSAWCCRYILHALCWAGWLCFLLPKAVGKEDRLVRVCTWFMPLHTLQFNLSCFIESGKQCTLFVCSAFCEHVFLYGANRTGYDYLCCAEWTLLIVMTSAYTHCCTVVLLKVECFLQMSGWGAFGMCLMLSKTQRAHVKDTTPPSKETSCPGSHACLAGGLTGCCGFFGLRCESYDACIFCLYLIHVFTRYLASAHTCKLLYVWIVSDVNYSISSQPFILKLCNNVAG